MTVWRFGKSATKANRASLGRRLIYHIGLRIAAAHRLDLPRARVGRQTTQTVGQLMAAARAAPFASLRSLTRGGPIIVIAPHPDDETLGCGGLLAACAAAHIPAHVFILTDGSLSHPNGSVTARGLSRLRLNEAVVALRALGLGPKALHRNRNGLRDGRALLDGAGIRRAAQRLARFAVKINAKQLFVAWRHDPHPDHMAAAVIAEHVRAAAPRLRVLHYPIRGRFLPPQLALASEHWTATRFDIRPFLARKRRAMAAYKSQTTPLLKTGAFAFRFRADEAKPFLGPAELFFEQRP